MHKIMDPCSSNNVPSSTAKPWSSLALVKNDSCAAERLAKPQVDSSSAGAWRLAGINRTQSRNKEQSPDW